MLPPWCFLRVVYVAGLLGGGSPSTRAGVHCQALGQAALGEQRERGYPVLLRLPLVPRALLTNQEAAGRAQLAGVNFHASFFFL